jgi:threonine aldolase
LTIGAPGTQMRLVTHRDVSSKDLDRALDAFRSVLG